MPPLAFTPTVHCNLQPSSQSYIPAYFCSDTIVISLTNNLCKVCPQFDCFTAGKFWSLSVLFNWATLGLDFCSNIDCWTFCNFALLHFSTWAWCSFSPPGCQAGKVSWITVSVVSIAFLVRSWIYQKINQDCVWSIFFALSSLPAIQW